MLTLGPVIFVRELSLDLRVLTLGLIIFCERAKHRYKGANPRFKKFYLKEVGGS